MEQLFADVGWATGLVGESLGDGLDDVGNHSLHILFFGHLQGDANQGLRPSRFVGPIVEQRLPAKVVQSDGVVVDARDLEARALGPRATGLFGEGQETRQQSPRNNMKGNECFRFGKECKSRAVNFERERIVENHGEPL